MMLFAACCRVSRHVVSLYMKKITLISIFCFQVFGLAAQVLFKAISPSGPVTVGESFQLQYVVENASALTDFTAPSFKGFRMAHGPAIYYNKDLRSSSSVPMKNMVYTLVALHPGHYLIKGATAVINGKTLYSNDVAIQVSDSDALSGLSGARPSLDDTEYYLHPGEDPYGKIKKDLFMKVTVDRPSCYVGQPVVATFKLYSRVQSRSDIIKNPGFYGFTVQDMVGLEDKAADVEQINGKAFEVHTVRKVQLYPLRPGNFTVDPMEVMNRVEFSRRLFSKTMDQEITEGVLNQPKADTGNALVFENTMTTQPLPIRVRPLPDKEKPVAYAGAVGKLSVAAALDKAALAKNEEGRLVVTISGKGNFNQLTAPSIQWPTGLEGFEAGTKDDLDKTQAPLVGKKSFYFSFTALRPGDYTIPSIAFSFFDPDTNQYRTVVTGSLQVRVRNSDASRAEITPPSKRPNAFHYYWLWILLGLALVGICGAWLYRGRSQRRLRKAPPVQPASLSVAECLQPSRLFLRLFLDEDGNVFFMALREGIWLYLSKKFELSGSHLSKKSLVHLLQQKGYGTAAAELNEILGKCEEGIYTKAAINLDKALLWQQGFSVLQRIEEASTIS